MAEQKPDNKGLVLPSTIMAEAMRLLEQFSSSGISTKWRISSWNGMFSLLLVWGKKEKESRRSKHRSSSGRKKTSWKRRLWGRRKQRNGEVSGKRGNPKSSLVSSPVYSELSGDDVFPPGLCIPQKKRAPLSSDSLFSVESLKRLREMPVSLSSHELSNEEAFVYDSLKRRKGGSASRSVARDDSLSRAYGRKVCRMSSDEAFLYDSIKRSQGFRTGHLSTDEMFAEDMLRRYKEKAHYSEVVGSIKDGGSCSPPGKGVGPVGDVSPDRSIPRDDHNLYFKERGCEDLVAEQLKEFSDETLMYESLRRKNADIPLHAGWLKNELCDVSNYSCDFSSRYQDETQARGKCTRNRDEPRQWRAHNEDERCGRMWTKENKGVQSFSTSRNRHENGGDSSMLYCVEERGSSENETAQEGVYTSDDRNDEERLNWQPQVHRQEGYEKDECENFSSFRREKAFEKVSHKVASFAQDVARSRGIHGSSPAPIQMDVSVLGRENRSLQVEEDLGGEAVLQWKSVVQRETCFDPDPIDQKKTCSDQIDHLRERREENEFTVTEYYVKEKEKSNCSNMNR